MRAPKHPVPTLHGTYSAPPLRPGARASCLVRDRTLIVRDWSDAPIPWPRGYAPTERTGGGVSLVVDEALARAVRTESAAAVAYWWGVSGSTVVKWRRALGATRKNNPGTQVLVRAATAKALEEALACGVSDLERERRGRQARLTGPWQFSPPVTYGVPWLPEHAALLGTMPDPEVARRTGHSVNAVRIRRRQVGVPRFEAHPPVGASFEKRTGRWCARMNVRGKRVSLGTFATRDEAAMAYQEGLRRFFGGRADKAAQGEPAR